MPVYPKTWGTRLKWEDGKFHRLGISDEHYYATKPQWNFEDEDGKQVQLALILEIMDLRELGIDEDEDDVQFPFLFEISVVVAYPGPKWISAVERSTDANVTETPDMILINSFQYGSGVPVTHVLLHEMKHIDISPNVDEIMWKTKRHDHGTIAAQYGRGHRMALPQFEDDYSALEYAKALLPRAREMFALGTAYLGLPINLNGDTGWDTVAEQAR
jgi:hypothetical protein